MHGKFIQVSATVTSGGVLVVYAVDDTGKVWEKLPGVKGSKWVNIT